MRRRSFVKVCALGAGAMAAGPGLLFSSDLVRREYSRVRLVDFHGQPLRPAELSPQRHYVFNYPYLATPCFLLNLNRPVPGLNGLSTEQGDRYAWQGGVGPQRSLVAYSAICAHKMAHPTTAVSYISFRQPRNGDDPETGVISCCAENSVYDPFRGGRVISGPAPQPLAAIVLEYDAENDALYAQGTLGGEMFRRFFSEFEARLSLEYPDGDAARPLEGDVEVIPLERYSANIMQC